MPTAVNDPQTVVGLPEQPRKTDDLLSWAKRLTAVLAREMQRTRTNLETQPIVMTRRLHSTLGRSLGTGDFAWSAGWGAVTAKTAFGNDQRGEIDFTSGTVGAGPYTVTLTFKDGAWPIASFALVVRNDVSNPVGGITWATTTTTLVITFNTAPVNATAYKVAFSVLG